MASAIVLQRNARGERRDQGRTRSSMNLPPDVGGHAGWQQRGHGTAGLWVPRGRDEPFAPHAAAFVVHHDAPLIGERAATRGRGATEGGDEHAGVG
jgi:hypothetical protein